MDVEPSSANCCLKTLVLDRKVSLKNCLNVICLEVVFVSIFKSAYTIIEDYHKAIFLFFPIDCSSSCNFLYHTINIFLYKQGKKALFMNNFHFLPYVDELPVKRLNVTLFPALFHFHIKQYCFYLQFLKMVHRNAVTVAQSFPHFSAAIKRTGRSLPRDAKI